MQISAVPRHPLPAWRRCAGVTLVELMVVLSMLAILAAVAAPGFSEVLRRQRVNTVVEQLTASMAFARTEAIRHGRPVVIRRIEPCAEQRELGDWACGWRVFVDADGNERLDAGENLLQEVQATPGVTLRTNGLTPTLAFRQINRFGVYVGGGIQVFPIDQDPNELESGGSISENRRICTSGSRLRVLKGVTECDNS